MRYLLLAASLSLLFIFAGCEKKSETTQNKDINSNTKDKTEEHPLQKTPSVIDEPEIVPDSKIQDYSKEFRVSSQKLRLVPEHSDLGKLYDPFVSSVSERQAAESLKRFLNQLIQKNMTVTSFRKDLSVQMKELIIRTGKEYGDIIDYRLGAPWSSEKIIEFPLLLETNRSIRLKASLIMEQVPENKQWILMSWNAAPDQ